MTSPSIPSLITWHHSPELHTPLSAWTSTCPPAPNDKERPAHQHRRQLLQFRAGYAVTWLPKAAGKFRQVRDVHRKTKNTDSVFQASPASTSLATSSTWITRRQLVGEWAFGISGYYLTQVSNDKFNGTTVPENSRHHLRRPQGQVFAFGPSVKCTTKTGTMFIGQWQHETMVENRFQGDKLWSKADHPAAITT